MDESEGWLQPKCYQPLTASPPTHQDNEADSEPDPRDGNNLRRRGQGMCFYIVSNERSDEQKSVKDTTAGYLKSKNAYTELKMLKKLKNVGKNLKTMMLQIVTIPYNFKCNIAINGNVNR